jgi:hypothetical protein
MLIYRVQVVIHYTHRKPLLKNPANDKPSMCEVKTLWKNGVRGIKDTSMSTSYLINNK